METIKTVEEWFLELPEPYRTQALNNLEEGDRENNRDKQFKHMSSAINAGFTWVDTEQGSEYWANIAHIYD